MQLSRGLHDQLLTCKENLFSLREQLILLGDEKLLLIDERNEVELKSERLKVKSKTVLDELLLQQKKVKALQYELLSAREDLTGMVENCTGASHELRTQFNLTMEVLKDKVITNREYQDVLKKVLEDKVKVENTLESMQYTVYNLTQELSKAKRASIEGAETLKKQQSDLDSMAEQVTKANHAMDQAAKMLQGDSVV